MRGLSTILFDLDDTLYPERQYVESGMAAVAAFLAARSGGSAPAIAIAMLAELDREGRGAVFDQAVAELGLSSSLVPALVHLYRTHAPRLSLFPEVRVALARLRAQGFALGLVTDGKSAMQSRKVAALGLDSVLDVVVATDDLGPGAGKPAPDGYRVALARIGAEPAQALYVGDDPAKDFAGARALGLGTVRLERHLPHPLKRGSGVEADLVLPDLGALADRLALAPARAA